MSARLYARIALSLTASAAASAAVVPVSDASFETESGALPNPLLFPPLQGEIGGWNLARSGLGTLTGLTAPRMWINDSSFATDGSQIAAISFVAGVLSQGQYSQTLAAEVQANTCYTLTVDVGTAGVADVLAEPYIQLRAGGVTIADSDEGSLLVILDLGPGFHEWTLRAPSSANPPAGALEVVLGARGVLDVVTGVGFDNVRVTAHSLTCPADLVPNQIVDISDLALLLSDFGCHGPCQGDLDCDADTDLADLALLLSSFGLTCN